MAITRKRRWRWVCWSHHAGFRDNDRWWKDETADRPWVDLSRLWWCRGRCCTRRLLHVGWMLCLRWRTSSRTDIPTLRPLWLLQRAASWLAGSTVVIACMLKSNRQKNVVHHARIVLLAHVPHLFTRLSGLELC